MYPGMISWKVPYLGHPFRMHKRASFYCPQTCPRQFVYELNLGLCRYTDLFILQPVPRTDFYYPHMVR
jgi:hypothetical protein